MQQAEGADETAEDMRVFGEQGRARGRPRAFDACAETPDGVADFGGAVRGRSITGELEGVERVELEVAHGIMPGLIEPAGTGQLEGEHAIDETFRSGEGVAVVLVDGEDVGAAAEGLMAVGVRDGLGSPTGLAVEVFIKPDKDGIAPR